MGTGMEGWDAAGGEAEAVVSGRFDLLEARCCCCCGGRSSITGGNDMIGPCGEICIGHELPYKNQSKCKYGIFFCAWDSICRTPHGMIKRILP